MKRGIPQSRRRSQWAFMERFVIPNLDDPTETYLTRWRIIQTPWCALYLHRMDGPDSRATLHDHPWTFVSIVLRGGYVERRLDPKTLDVDEIHTIRRVNIVRTYNAHSIRRLLRYPTWTLLFVGPRRRTWGYWEPVGHMAGSRVPFVDDPHHITWRWTEFDKHPHEAEFRAAMAKRVS